MFNIEISNFIVERSVFDEDKVGNDFYGDVVDKRLMVTLLKVILMMMI